MSGDGGVLTRPERAARQIAEIVRAAGAGSRLDTKGEIRQARGVSAGTFNEALRLAQSRGLVEARPGPPGALRRPAVAHGAAGQLGPRAGRDETSVADAIRIRDSSCCA